MANNSINITIKNKEGVILKKDAFSVSSFNTQGYFDILPFHENFISIIKELIVINKNTKEKKEIKIGSGILKANQNKVDIYII